MCARHIFANLKKRHGSADPLHKLFWKCARAYNKHVFEKNLEKMKTVKIDAYEQVKKSVNSNWSRYVCSLNNICIFWLVLYLLAVMHLVIVVLQGIFQ